MKNILFLKLGPSFYPDEIPNRLKYEKLSEHHEGLILAVVNDRKYRRARIGRFELKGLYLPAWVRFMGILRDIAYFPYALWAASVHHFRAGKFDVVVSYDPLVTGFMAILLAKLLGIKSIVEVNGNFLKSFQYQASGRSKNTGIKRWIVERVTPFVFDQSDGVKLLYKGQVSPAALKNNREKVRIFHNFVPISIFRPGKEGEKKYILFMGFPWYLKGVDLLITAFRMISDRYPEVSLKIVGFCPDRSYFEGLVGENKHIELLNPVFFEKAIQLIENCHLFVLPSRTEAMGRVLLEAMAAGKPIIAANVDGIPTYIRDGYNGLLFEGENTRDLSEKMEILLGNSEYMEEIGKNGLKHVWSELSEDAYVNKYNEMMADLA